MTKKTKKERATKGSRWWGLLVFGLLVLIDQLTKLFAEVYFLAGNEPIDVIPEWISLRLAYNDGIAYGIGSDASAGVKIAVIAATAVMMALLAVAYCKMDNRRAFLRVAFIFVIAGGVGNLIDRVYFRVWETAETGSFMIGVRDMVDVHRFGFGVCNFADIFISAGAVMIVLALLFFDRDAIFPLGKKYKALAKEAEEKEEAKKAKKQAEKQAKNG
ncbi:MAG: signal peptidase II [Clostridia bacterium]|nr:signal peptidase II [Clostridia bacterium]